MKVKKNISSKFKGEIMTNDSAYKSDESRAKVIACYDNILKTWPVAYESLTVNTSFGDTHVILSGTKGNKPLVLLHGGGGNSTMWRDNVASLSRHFHVYAIDIIGDAGKSAGTRPAFTTDAHSRWLKEVFDSFGIKNAAVCGASLGGTIAHQFALKFPELINSLVLLAPPSLWKMRTSFVMRFLLANIWPTAFFATSFLKHISARANEFKPIETQTFVLQIQSCKLNMNVIPVISDDDLSRLPSKTLIMFGSDEVIYNPAKVTLRINSVAPLITVNIIPGAKHTVSVDQPDIFNERLIQFLR